MFKSKYQTVESVGDDRKLEPGFPLALIFKIGVILVNLIM